MMALPIMSGVPSNILGATYITTPKGYDVVRDELQTSQAAASLHKQDDEHDDDEHIDGMSAGPAVLPGRAKPKLSRSISISSSLPDVVPAMESPTENNQDDNLFDNTNQESKEVQTSPNKNGDEGYVETGGAAGRCKDGISRCLSDSGEKRTHAYREQKSSGYGSKDSQECIEKDFTDDVFETIKETKLADLKRGELAMGVCADMEERTTSSSGEFSKLQPKWNELLSGGNSLPEIDLESLLVGGEHIEVLNINSCSVRQQSRPSVEELLHPVTQTESVCHYSDTNLHTDKDYDQMRNSLLEEQMREMFLNGMEPDQIIDQMKSIESRDDYGIPERQHPPEHVHVMGHTDQQVAAPQTGRSQLQSSSQVSKNYFTLTKNYEL